MKDIEQRRQEFARKTQLFSKPQSKDTEDTIPLPTLAQDRKTREPLTSQDLSLEDRGLVGARNRGIQQGLSDIASIAGAGMTGGTLPLAFSAGMAGMNAMREPGRASGSRAQIGGEVGNVLFNMLQSKVPAPLRGMAGQVGSALVGTTAEQGLETLFGTVSPEEARENIMFEGVLPASLGGLLGAAGSGIRNVRGMREAFGENFTDQQINNLGLAANLKAGIGRSVNRLLGGLGGFKTRRDHFMTAAALERMQQLGFVPDVAATISESGERGARRSVQSTLQAMKKKATDFSELVAKRGEEGTNLAPVDAKTGKARVIRNQRGVLSSFQDDTPLPKNAETIEVFPGAFKQAREFLDEAVINPKKYVQAIGTKSEGELSDDALEVINFVASPEEKMAFANAYVRHHFVGNALAGGRQGFREAVNLGADRRVSANQPGIVSKAKGLLGQNTDEVKDAVILDAKKMQQSLDAEDMDERRVVLALGGSKVGEQRLQALRSLSRVLADNDIGARESGNLGKVVSYLGNKTIFQLGFGGLAGMGVLGGEVAAGATLIAGVGTMISAALNSPAVMSGFASSMGNPREASRFMRQLIQQGEFQVVPSPGKDNEYLLVPKGEQQPAPQGSPDLNQLIFGNPNPR